MHNPHPLLSSRAQPRDPLPFTPRHSRAGGNPASFLFAILLTIIFCFTTTPAHATLGPDDTLIIPGERIGPITKNTTEAELIKKFGPKNVATVLYYQGEGTSQCATELFPNTKKSLMIVWQGDDQTFESTGEHHHPSYLLEECKKNKAERSPQSIIIGDCPISSLESECVEKQGSAWKTKEGVRVGMNLQQLAQANTKPITVSLCECDTTGVIANWNHGKLAGKIQSMQSNIDNFMPKGNEFEVWANSSEVSTAQLPAEMNAKIIILDMILAFEK